MHVVRGRGVLIYLALVIAIALFYALQLDQIQDTNVQLLTTLTQDSGYCSLNTSALCEQSDCKIGVLCTFDWSLIPKIQAGNQSDLITLSSQMWCDFKNRDGPCSDQCLKPDLPRACSVDGTCVGTSVGECNITADCEDLIFADEVEMQIQAQNLSYSKACIGSMCVYVIEQNVVGKSFLQIGLFC